MNRSGEYQDSIERHPPIPIQIKATREGFILVPNERSSFEQIMAYMKRRLAESQEFFHRSTMTLDLSRLPLRTDEILKLRNLLLKEAEVKLTEVKLDDGLNLILERGLPRPEPPRKARPEPRPSNLSPMIVRSTCRSGTRIESPADCVVLGDVNPGAEVIALGDIIIFGSLRGVAHAGAGGDYTAKIWALNIEPNQLRIADLVAVPPRGGKPTPKRFEVAEIRDNVIQVITK